MATYDERMKKAYDMGAIHHAFVERGVMDDDQFDRVLEGTLAIRRLLIPGLEWLLLDQLLSVCWGVPLDEHYACLGAGMQGPYRGIQELYERMIGLDLLPSSVLNQTSFHRVPELKVRFGELLLALGLVDDVTVQRALGIKMIIKDKTGLTTSIGQIFRSVGNVSIVDFFQALGIQVGIPFVSLDESAPAIFAAAVQRHK